MKTSLPIRFVGLNIVAVIALVWPQWAGAFEGRIAAELVRGTETTALLYTVGPEHLRIEVTGSDWPHPINVVELKSGAITLLFPHNRSFVRLENGGASRGPDQTPFGTAAPPALPIPPGIGPQPSFPTPAPGARPPGASLPNVPAIPNAPTPAGLPPGIGPQPPTAGTAPGLPAPPPLPAGLPPGIGPQPPTAGAAPTLPNLPGPAGLPAGIGPQPPAAGGFPGMPAMPMPMMAMPGEKLELKSTTDTKDILGFSCTRYEIKQRGQTLEIWATDKLFPYRTWLRNQPTRFGPRMLEEQWPELLQSRKLFPLRATMRLDGGAETFRFEVKSVTPEKIADEKQFVPPAEYHELRPLPF